MSQDKVGDVLVAQGDLTAALEAYRTSLAIFERRAAHDAGNAGRQRDLSAIQEKLGDVLAEQGTWRPRWRSTVRPWLSWRDSPRRMRATRVLLRISGAASW